MTNQKKPVYVLCAVYILEVRKEKEEEEVDEKMKAFLKEHEKMK